MRGGVVEVVFGVVVAWGWSGRGREACSSPYVVVAEHVKAWTRVQAPNLLRMAAPQAPPPTPPTAQLHGRLQQQVGQHPRSRDSIAPPRVTSVVDMK